MDLEGFLTKHVRPSAQHTCFYHFTDEANLALICKHGLLSTRQLRATNMFKAVTPGGDTNSLNSDLANGTDNYARLCFTQNHPMAYAAANDARQRNFTYLRVNPEIIKQPGVMITNAPSNQNGVIPIAAAPGLDTLDLEIIYTWKDWNIPTFKNRIDIADKYEILVPISVPANFILSP